MVILAAFVLSGCAWTDARGTRHTIIFGFGVVSTKEQEGISVRDSRGVGVLAEPGAIGVGWAQRHVVSIDPNVARNVIVSIGATPLSLKVESQSPTETNLEHSAVHGTKGETE